ncbi:hypothetical protein [Psychroflexus planctonicus]|uniref:Tissue inhibitor of metalloproteinase n=1 Tax=Psychroflexus planctonicus TaxID=1526575 RepID=A0ABQ1SCV7_9FLAO|nr:hypothetical protein [Psychroflexus planctonicus]GGE29186.1 hypothetical protein GCM10010832_07190 [Psychroflexus planctonicus]
MKTYTLFFILHFTVGFACNCTPNKDHEKHIESSFNYYDEIFIGEVEKNSNETMIEVQEVFKGDLKTEKMLRAGIKMDSCSYYFGEEGTAIFYGIIVDNTFYASVCSPTRMFSRPYLYPPPPPPVPDSDFDSEKRKRKMTEYLKNEKQRLEYEIDWLRKRKKN